MKQPIITKEAGFLTIDSEFEVQKQKVLKNIYIDKAEELRDTVQEIK